MAPQGTFVSAPVQWPYPFVAGWADPLLPVFPVTEYRNAPDSKYGESTDFHFHHQSTDFKDFGVYEHRPHLSTGPVDLPAEDPLFSTDLFIRGLKWARHPLPGSDVSRAVWELFYFH